MADSKTITVVNRGDDVYVTGAYEADEVNVPPGYAVDLEIGPKGGVTAHTPRELTSDD